MTAPKVLPTLARRRSALASVAEQQRVLEAVPLEASFDEQLKRAGLPPLRAAAIETLQLNLGRVCNQTCNHCHVDAGPDRTENMSRATAELALSVLATTEIPTVDITGGAPELCPQFEYLVRGARDLGRRVIDRCNLTILLAERFSHLPDFFAEHGVEVVCSLPHYRELNTDRQRGAGTFALSIEALKRLNAVGYGVEGSGLKLVLVTNPVGAFLPGGQASLSDEWKREMRRLHGIEFSELFAITNMPISRFLEWLQRSENLEGYMQRLLDAFNPRAVSGLMCRTTLSVGWDGRLFDCDFNQMLELELEHGVPRTLAEFDAALLEGRRILTGRHCFGCTAGSGSSCGGALE